ncbi:MAG: YbjN domain-containing protein [Deltaproteobacteria bacterium]|nr:YbjN domain-containing protein [Deltaproteobacteria bacterium]
METSTNEEIDRAVALVESVLGGLGLEVDVAGTRIASPGGGHAWSLQRGSAAVAIFLRPPRDGEDSPQLRVVSPILKVDPGGAEALYKALLELNAQGLAGVAFGVHHERVVVVAERRTRDLDAAGLEYVIRRVGAVGDHYDDSLRRRFGGTRVSDLS